MDVAGDGFMVYVE